MSAVSLEIEFSIFKKYNVMENSSQKQVTGIQQAFCPPNADIKYNCLYLYERHIFSSIVAVHELNGDTYSTWTSEKATCVG